MIFIGMAAAAFKLSLMTQFKSTVYRDDKARDVLSRREESEALNNSPGTSLCSTGKLLSASQSNVLRRREHRARKLMPAARCALGKIFTSAVKKVVFVIDR